MAEYEKWYLLKSTDVLHYKVGVKWVSACWQSGGGVASSSLMLRIGDACTNSHNIAVINKRFI